MRTLKHKVITLILFSFLFAGCGITYGSYDPDTKQLIFWLGKEYESFTLIYKKGEEQITIEAKNVGAIEGQKLIKEGLVDAVKAGVKAAVPIP